MPACSDYTYQPHEPAAPTVNEDTIESGFIGRLQGLKYDYRPDITDRAYYFANNNARHFSEHEPALAA